jgi:hypothetical protein
MIRVVGTETLENCLDNSVVKELRLAECLEERVMHRIAREGRLQYFPHFPRPYFRIDRRGVYVVQGVFGNTTLRVTFSSQAGPSAEKELIGFIETALPSESAGPPSEIG